MSRGDEPAYPVDEDTGRSCRGMDIREAFAKDLMAAMLGNEKFALISKEDRAELALKNTDALLEALARPKS